jgi:phage shock protein PspC (stress-responsive transcriptional regulator)
VARERREDALLAGVCAGIANALGWNVWALRTLFVVFLLVKTLWAVALYAALAVGLYLMERRPGRRGGAASRLRSPELSARSERIAELERRFRELED